MTSGTLANETHASRAIARVHTDTRTIQAGDLFVALAGERFDGHAFVAQARAAGAVAALVHRDVDVNDASFACIRVTDTLRALGDLAFGWRRRFALPTIAVTGSNGKTTVKEMIASILAAACGAEHRLATQGNLNNEIGVPLTVLRLNDTHRAAVIELGMNHPGEIARIARIAQPNVALVNNAQREHQEFMASVEAVAAENAACFAQLAADGVAVFPAGTPYDALWRDLAGRRACLTFGLDEGDVRCQATQDAQGLRLSLSGAVTIDAVRLQTVGLHNALNATAAAACAHAAGVSADAIARGLEAFAPVKGRLVQKRRANGALVIDDTYNANPDSVRAAIDVLAAHGASTVLVLGDMGEVGDQGPAFHREVGEYAKARGIGRLICVGDATRDTARAYGANATHYTQHTDAIDAVRDLAPPQVALVKGSRFMRMEHIVAALVEQEQEHAR
ncbi:MAG TPA: UDP-N-acetylmuramoyl-tripeptide--D-alanyl-D-alanine ligase [Burkholderiaceae bacterium]|nr:UDP-N-acetylmuramoyl-tripeptide--D-alanyl-D-alanine ligase [Burkholderiaceae bacterium]